MMKKHSYTFILLLAFFSFNQLFSQQKIKLIEGASTLVAGQKDDGQNYNKFTRMPALQLLFMQEKTKIYCDTAKLFREQNIIEAVGKILINDQDSILITADSLIYNGNTKIAELRGNVVLIDDSVTLYTNHLDYDRTKSLAYYFNTGKLIDPTNTLDSEKGYYLTNSKIMSFKDDVVLINPDYQLLTDTLVYNTLTKVASTFALTEVTGKNGTKVIAQGSTYESTIAQTSLTNGTIESPDYILTGDKLFFDDIKDYYTATNNVTMVSKANDIIITGDYAISKKKEGNTKVYQNALMKKILKEDTLFLSADTLISIEDSIPSNKRLLAYKNVRIYKKNLQGVSDSLAYFTSDSIIYLYDDPVLWAGFNQMKADSINVEIYNGTIDRMNLSYNSFVIQRDTLLEFNQIKGRKMTAFFEGSAIEQVNVYGNSESLYYALENDSVMIGLNSIVSSNMLMMFEKNRVKDISFYTNPESHFIPPHEITDENKRLEGFDWRDSERPTKASILYPNEVPIEESPNIIPPTKLKEMLPGVEKLLRREKKIEPLLNEVTIEK